MAANLKELVEKLIDMNVGESARLGYILNFLERGRTSLLIIFQLLTDIGTRLNK